MQEPEVKSADIIGCEVPLSEQPIILINPINGEPVDEVIKQKEAETRGYMDLQFILRHLEDENEFVMFFIVNGKKILVDISRPKFEYKKPTHINHERVLEVTFTGGEAKRSSGTGCGIHDPVCEACGS